MRADIGRRRSCRDVCAALGILSTVGNDDPGVPLRPDPQSAAVGIFYCVKTLSTVGGDALGAPLQPQPFCMASPDADIFVINRAVFFRANPDSLIDITVNPYEKSTEYNFQQRGAEAVRISGGDLSATG